MRGRIGALTLCTLGACQAVSGLANFGRAGDHVVAGGTGGASVASSSGGTASAGGVKPPATSGGGKGGGFVSSGMGGLPNGPSSVSVSQSSSASSSIGGGGLGGASASASSGTGGAGAGCGHLVFVTSKTYLVTGFATHAAADAKCAALVDPNLPLTWKAVVYTNESNAKNYLGLFTGTVCLFKQNNIGPGATISTGGYAGWWAQDHSASISNDENGNLLPLEVKGNLVWTGTLANGSPSATTCEGWSTTDQAKVGTCGNFLDSKGGLWVEANTLKGCNDQGHLYCFGTLK